MKKKPVPSGQSRMKRCKLTWDQVDQIRKDRKAGDKIIVLARRYNISKTSTINVVNGNSYKDQYRTNRIVGILF